MAKNPENLHISSSRHNQPPTQNNHKNNNKQKKIQKRKKATFWQHYAILRKVLLQCLAIYLIAICVCFYIYEDLLPYLLRPLFLAMSRQNPALLAENAAGSGYKIIFTHIMEGFFAHFDFALTCGFILAFPFMLERLYHFLAPGLKPAERRHLWVYLLFAPLLFLAGAALAYYYVMPLAWNFFLGYQTPPVFLENNSKNIGKAGSITFSLRLEAKISEYLESFQQMILAFGLAFQLPLILVILNKFGILSREKLTYYRRHAIIAIFIVAAFLTPPDVISQVSLAVPMLLLYELGIWLCAWTSKQ